MNTTVNLQRLVEDALLAYADTAELDLTVRDTTSLSRAAVASLTASRVVLPRTATMLSGQELAMLRAIAAGEQAPDTARRLCLSVNTVKTHRRRLYKRLGATGAAHAVALGFAARLLVPPPVVEASADRLRSLMAPAGSGVRP